MGNRKIQMMKLSYFFTGVVALAYLIVCAYTKTAPSEAAMLVVFGSAGLIGGSANWANAQEHKAKAKQ